MKKKIILTALACISCATSMASAASVKDLEFTPYMGMDVQYARWDFESGLGADRFPVESTQLHGYFGADVHEYLGVELGYEASRKKTSSSVITAGTILLGTAATASQTAANAINYFSVRQQALHLDLLPKWQVTGYENSTIFGIIGLSAENMNITTYILGGGGDSIVSKLVRNKNKIIWRLGAGAKYKFNDNAGVRATVAIKNWSSIGNFTSKADANGDIGIRTAKMRDGFQIGLGVFARL